MTRRVIRLGGVLLLLVAAQLSPVHAEDVLAIEALADEVPAFTLTPAAGGATLDKATLAGRTVLLHFWATWCTPCKDELPALDKLAAELDPARYAVLLVAIDTNAAPAEIQAFAQGLGVRLPVYVAVGGGVSDSFWGWGLPVSYLIDAQGRFIGRLRGPRAWDTPAVKDALAALYTPPN